MLRVLGEKGVRVAIMVILIVIMLICWATVELVIWFFWLVIEYIFLFSA